MLVLNKNLMYNLPVNLEEESPVGDNDKCYGILDFAC